ncbi:MAG: tRNA lysidine(34) synthetase TilS, partial [Longimicrobiales bacterium]
KVAPGARRSLLRLARLARENEEAWGSLIPGLLEGLVEVGDRGVFVVRSAFLAYHPSLRGRLLREVLGRQGVNLDEAGTRALLEFTRTGASGRAFPLPGGYRFLREFDRFLLFEDGAPDEDQPLLLPGPEEGSGHVTVGGRTRRVRWGTGMLPAAEFRASFSVEGLAFPLRVRGWAPGDRIRLPAGTRKLKRLFGDRGIPAGERNRIPVVADASGNVLWVVGVAVSDRGRPGEAEATFSVGIEDVHES